MRAGDCNAKSAVHYWAAVYRPFHAQFGHMPARPAGMSLSLHCSRIRLENDDDKDKADLGEMDSASLAAFEGILLR
jgi:hypothetical protein